MLSLGGGRQERLLPVLWILPGLQMEAARLCLLTYLLCDHLQVFDELDKIGRSLTEAAQDGGFPVHDGKGDLRKCPYYADKLGRSRSTTELPHAYGTRLTAVTVLSVF